jgi:glutathione S-transferase
MMRWLWRGVVILLVLVGLLLAGGWAYARFVVGAVVNAPVTGILAEQFPSVFSRPRADAEVLAAHLRLPAGLELTVFARDIPDARMLRATRNGDLLLSGKGREAAVTKARKELIESLISLAPIFNEKPFFMSEEFTLVDCCVAPILWRLKLLGINLPERASRPLTRYMQRLFDRDAFRASLSEAELEMRE